MSTSSIVPSRPVGKHAIVVGGSLAGLITVGLLARLFEQVTLIERDRFEDTPEPRKGVPQAFHQHGVLSRGLGILSSFFPGVLEELEAAGAEFLDVTGDQAMYMGGSWRRPMRCGLGFYAQSRPLLEWVVRKRALAAPNVRRLDGREGAGFLADAGGGRVTGVRQRIPGAAREEALEGELVVDASGRGSRTPQWLEALGYPRVDETRIHVDVGYATRAFRRPRGLDAGWRVMSITPEPPRTRRMAVIMPVEGDRWLVGLAGWLGDHPPADEAGFLEFARGLPQPHVYQALQLAEPLGPISTYRFPHHQRRHYERMPRFPEGLAVVGDAFCSFNPIYGQGITTGAMQAEALGECLRAGLDGLARRYHRRASRLLEVPWSLATAGDLRFPEVQGRRPPGSGLSNWYGDRIQRLAAYDEEALRTFMQVLQLVKPPAALLSPWLVLKALTARSGAALAWPGPAPLPAPAGHMPASGPPGQRLC